MSITKRMKQKQQLLSIHLIVNHVNLINACWELFIKTIEKNNNTNKYQNHQSANFTDTFCEKNIFTVKRWKWEKIDLKKKKAPFPTGCGKVNFVSKGCIYWRSANFWKFCGFPLKQLGFWSTISVQHCTLLNCVVKYSSVLLSLYFRRYPFFSMCVEPSFFHVYF